MSTPGKYYPMQGATKYETVSFPITKAFRVDFGAATSGSTRPCVIFPKGAIVLGFSCRVTEAYESAGAGTISVGFTGTQMLSSATGSGVAVLGAIIGKSSTSINGGVVLTADDAFDVTSDASGAATAGKLDVFVHYIPVPGEPLNSTDFREYVST